MTKPQTQPSATPIIVLALTFLIASTSFAVDVSLPALPSLAQEAGSTLAQAQRTIGVFILGFAIGQIPMGMLGDHFGRRPVLLVGMSCFVALGLATAMTNSIDMLLVLRFLQGVAAASGTVLARAVARDLTSGQATVQLMAYLASAMGIAMVVAPGVGSIFLWLFGWRGPFMVSALWGGLGLLICFFVVPETRPSRPKGSLFSALAQGLKAFAHTRAARYGAAIAGLTFCAIMSFVTLSPAVLMEGLGLRPIQFALCFSFVSAGYVTGALVARRFARHLTSEQLLARVAIGLCLGAALCILCIWVGALALALMCLFFILGLIGANLGLSNAIALKPLGHVAGVAAGALGTVQLLTGATFSYASTFFEIKTMSALLVLFAAVSLSVAGAIFLYLRGAGTVAAESEDLS